MLPPSERTCQPDGSYVQCARVCNPPVLRQPHRGVGALECPKTHEKMKSGSILTANFQKGSFVHVDTKCEVLPNLNTISGSHTIFINQPLWLKSPKCKSRYIFSILF